ncbi:PRY1 [Verticillium alfalfae VaMs.102]|uniref:PRY1 n=1 Tax=Verticillium alfalfae (strain VaMs.102 / ATCC MYA-4576 / FGSC 10136) TaxID=526221 RepID=C9SRU7_VERA1|nr:PRY1 [Verticillium alfalfae VaMs.102]EEY21512.1 PRY1 [Verticillium alfalfae VaMs.102]
MLSANIIKLALLGAATTVLAQTTTIAPVLPSDEPEWRSDDAFTSAVVGTHNVYRSEHDAEDLVWNNTLAEYAEEYLDSDGDDDDECPDFEHSDTPYGENLAIGHANASAAVEAWGDERDEYDFDDQGFDQETGHFTQLVWKSTTDVGCARKLCRGGDWNGWYLVCEYWPRGNVQDQYEDQVSAGQFEGAAAGLMRSHQTAALVVALLGLWVVL